MEQPRYTFYVDTRKTKIVIPSIIVFLFAVCFAVGMIRQANLTLLAIATGAHLGFLLRATRWDTMRLHHPGGLLDIGKSV